MNQSIHIVVISTNVVVYVVGTLKNKNLIKTQYNSYIKPRQDWTEKKKNIMFVGLRCECDAKKHR